MAFTEVVIGPYKAIGIEVPLPNAPLILVVGKKGFIMCGYLDLATATRCGDAAAVVKGVNTVNEILERPVVAITPVAETLGITIGMSGRHALEKLF
jgi:uncharacterized protein YunC (DUF1805 family)